MNSLLTQKELDDAQHHENVGSHTDLWLSIIDKYKDVASSTIVGLGHLVVSPLIELSQWGFTIIYVSDAYERTLMVKKMAEEQAGNFKEILYMDFLKDCPRGRIIVSIGIAEHLPQKDMYRWLDLLVRRGNEVYLALPINDKDWYGLLSDRYDTVISKYRNGESYLVTIKKKYVTKPNRREEKNSSTRSKIKMVEKKSAKD